MNNKCKWCKKPMIKKPRMSACCCSQCTILYHRSIHNKLKRENNARKLEIARSKFVPFKLITNKDKDKRIPFYDLFGQADRSYIAQGVRLSAGTPLPKETHKVKDVYRGTTIKSVNIVSINDILKVIKDREDMYMKKCWIASRNSIRRWVGYLKVIEENV